MENVLKGRLSDGKQRGGRTGQDCNSHLEITFSELFSRRERGNTSTRRTFRNPAPSRSRTKTQVELGNADPPDKEKIELENRAEWGENTKVVRREVKTQGLPSPHDNTKLKTHSPSDFPKEINEVKKCL